MSLPLPAVKAFTSKPDFPLFHQPILIRSSPISGYLVVLGAAAVLEALLLHLLVADDLDLDVLGALLVALVVEAIVVVALVVAHGEPDLLVAQVRVAGDVLRGDAAVVAVAVVVVVEALGVVRLLLLLVDAQVARRDGATPLGLAAALVGVVHVEVVLARVLLDLDDDLVLEVDRAVVVLLVVERVALAVVFVVVSTLATIRLAVVVP